MENLFEASTENNGQEVSVSVRMENGVAVCDSRDIANIFGKRHDSVLRDIQNKVESLSSILWSPNSMTNYFIESTYVNSQNKQQPCYLLTRNGFTLLVMGYTGANAIKFQLAYIAEFDRMEAALQQPPQVKSTEPTIPEILTTEAKIGQFFGIPVHLMQIEAVKHVKKITGRDLSGYLQLSPIQDNIKVKDEAYEPTRLGKLFGFSGVEMNRLLENAGLQKKNSANGEWYPVGEATKFTSRHSFTRNNYSGYNLKWNVADVARVLNIKPLK